MKKNRWWLRFIALVLFVSTYFFSFRGFRGAVTNISVSIIVVYLVIYAINHFHYFVKHTKKYPSAMYIYLFGLLPIFTYPPCYLTHNQGLFHYVLAYIPHYLFLSYLLMAKKRLRSQDIINIILIFAMLRTCVTLIEQFTYPNVPFANRMDWYDDYGNFQELEVRSGFYRFMIGDAYFLVLFSAIYSFIQLQKEITIKQLLIFFGSVLGMYMDGTRQVMLAFACALLLYPFVNKNKGNLKYLFSLFAFVGIIMIYADALFGDLFIKTQANADNFNGRSLSYLYFWNNEGPWYNQIFGHGLGFSQSSWGRELKAMHELHIRPHDVGIVGAIYMVGWPIVLTFIAYYIFVVFRHWYCIDISLRLYLITTIVMLPMIIPLFNATLPCWEMFFGIIMYLVDTTIQGNRRLLTLKKNK